MELEYLEYVLGTHLFVKVPQPRDSKLEWRNLFGFRIKLPPVTTSLYPLIGRGNSIKRLAHTTSELADLSSHYPSFMLNVKQESCKFQLLKFFGLTRPENQTQVY